MRHLLGIAILMATLPTGAQANLIRNGDFSSKSLAEFTVEPLYNGSIGWSTPSIETIQVKLGILSYAAAFQVGSANMTGNTGGARISQTITTEAGLLNVSFDYLSYAPSPNYEGGRYTLLLDGVGLAYDNSDFISSGQGVRNSLSAASLVGAGQHVVAIDIVRFSSAASYTPYQYVDNISAELTSLASVTVTEPLSLTLLALGTASALALRKRTSA